MTSKRFTQKYMVNDYERLYDHASLLDLYLFDTQSGAKPDATEHYRDKNCNATVQLWRAKGAAGGYVIVKDVLPNIWYLDEAISMYADNHSEYTVAIRVCLERLRITRNRLYEAGTGDCGKKET
jgi:hypothetical protein